MATCRHCPVRHALVPLQRPCQMRRVFSSIYGRNGRLYSTSDRVSNDSVLFVSPVWPERTSSAAGVRTSDLIDSFLAKENRVHYASMASPNEHSAALENSGVAGVYSCKANRKEDFKRILDATRPTTVIFDRFYAEEMFSYIVRDHMPQAMRVLDMQDVHFLRTWRQGIPQKSNLGDAIQSMPPSSYEPCLRELASIYRCDLTCVCSPREMDILQDVYGIGKDRLVEAGFFNGPSEYESKSRPFGERQDAMMIGNFRHPPNADSVQWACRDVWPAIRSAMMGHETKLPSLHVYGAYSSGNQSLDNQKHGIEFHGFAPSLDIMLQYRVLFAPLRFGAGLKGKIVDAWNYGMPVVTTLVGSEGMHLGADWGGLGSAATEEDIVKNFITLYTDEAVWNRCQRRGFRLLDMAYNRNKALSHVHESLDARYENLTSWRNSNNYIGEVLWSQSMRSTEYFSRWIELKETCSREKNE